MFDFTKQQRANLLNNVIQLIREKYELFQTINILKQSLSTEIVAVEQQLKTEEKLEKNLAANEIDIKCYILQIKKDEIEKIKSNIKDLEKNKDSKWKNNKINYPIREMDKKIEQLKIKALDIKIKNINEQIIILEKAKTQKYKNIFFKIISLFFL